MDAHGAADENEQPGHPLLEGEFFDPPIEDQNVLEYFVIRQEVNLEVNFRERRIDGSTDIFIVLFNDKIEEVSFDAADCDIDITKTTVTEVRESEHRPIFGQPRQTNVTYNDPYDLLAPPSHSRFDATHHDLRRRQARNVFHSRRNDVPAEGREFVGCTPAYGSLKVSLKGKPLPNSKPKLIVRKSGLDLENADAPAHKQFKISIHFSHKNPRDGVHFVGVDTLDNRFPHMYTRHSLHPGTASCIFPCIDDHGCRCAWTIAIKYPRTLGDALRQALASQNPSSPAEKNWELAEEDKLREMSVVCSGLLVGESDDPEDEHKKIMIFEPEKKVSVQQLGFAVGPFEHIDLSSESRTEEDELKLGMSALKVHAYALPGRASWVRNTTAALTMAADFMTFTFAKYPFNNFKLCFLDDMVDDIVPLHSMAFASNRMLFPEDVIDYDPEVTRRIVFALTYQWTGINMIPNTRHDMWLVIGLAHYMTDLFMKKLCGNNEYRFRMKMLSDDLVKRDVNRACLYDLGPQLHLDKDEVDFMDMKSAVVLFILDKRLSKASGGHGLTRVLSRMITKNAIESHDQAPVLDTEKFRLTCEKSAKFRLESFWDQWVKGSGCPHFDVKARFNKKRLCVELTLNQIQAQLGKSRKLTLDEDHLLRIIKEKRAGIPTVEQPSLFTGPMTVRIHEADGTPYEHILEIREDASRSTKFEIPYNTKYKRLKRTRRMKEKNNAGAGDAQDNPDEALLYSLGDVLSTPEEQKEWELIEWDPETERKMDQESYEWIRIDADFEWTCDMTRNLEPYMYVSQLQQDRDVVAQQDAMIYLTNGPLHPIASGFLVRTLVDQRYYHGIRTMAARALPRQANIKGMEMLGLRQLMRAFREMFCFENTNQPLPNDFRNKQQYLVRCEIIKAIASVRDSDHRCPLEARQFILDQLMFNNNEDNDLSDQHYIALLVEALATSLIPSKKDDWLAQQTKVMPEGERAFLDAALEQIERVLRRDEWTNSYHNIWTTAGLDAKQRLMKAEVIPQKWSEFGQYLIDGTSDEIRIKCFDALIDLGAMMDVAFSTFLLYSLTTDRSPYVRQRLIHAMSRGLAAIAFGYHTKVAPKPVKNEFEIDDDNLLVVDSGQEQEARKEMIERKENLEVALKALRKEMEETYKVNAPGNSFTQAMTQALNHAALGRAEMEDLLVLAGTIYQEAQDWVVALKLPYSYKVVRDRDIAPLGKRLMLQFQKRYKTTSKAASMPPPPPVVSTPLPTSVPVATSEPASRPSLQKVPSIKIKTKPSIASPAARTASPKPSSSSSEPTPRPAIVDKADRSVLSAPIKRPREGETPTASKRPKTESIWDIPEPSSSKKSRMLTLKTKNPKRLALVLGQKVPERSHSNSPGAARTSLPGSSSREPSHGVDKVNGNKIRKALPGAEIRRPLPVGGERKSLPGGSGDSVRKSLPGTGPSASAEKKPKSQSPVKAETPAPKKSESPAPSAGSTPAIARPKIKIKVKPKVKDPAPPPS